MEFHIIGVSESRKTPPENRDILADYNLPSYSMLSCEWQNKKVGGVLFYVKASLNPTVLQTKKNW